MCPDGWRLLTYNDFYIVFKADGNTHGVEGARSAYGFGGYNTTGYSLVGVGYLWNHVFTGVKEATYWYYPVESDYDVNTTSLAGSQSPLSTSNTRSSNYKTQGFSVRCVMVE
ncbi:FISUMP domain-containing protein [Fibrobacter sp.]|uniref:FISUMP domain-containing protein n=1 Tax=Fibrobacter sp. TaxID=35828 RepID=UPI00261DD267|nr:FISUMP domain-containing protein [Fibrobacter sp.]MDD5941425.1 FISUMP domain-containing protein [Fibrobacter sp.]